MGSRANCIRGTCNNFGVVGELDVQNMDPIIFFTGQQTEKIKAKTNEQTSGFSGKTKMEYKRRIRMANKATIKNENESTLEVEHRH